MNEQPESGRGQGKMSRRRFMGLTLFGSVVATIGGVLAPIIAYLWPPARAAGAASLKTPVGTAVEFPVNSGKVVSVDNKPVIVVNTDQGGLKAFSAVCTHLGCIVYWHEQRGVIQCPCHDGRFNPLNGNVIMGPPPAPLAEYLVQIEGEQVVVGAPSSA